MFPPEINNEKDLAHANSFTTLFSDINFFNRGYYD